MIKILYIVSTGRSGSTLLSQILGQINGFFNTGDLSYIWEDGFAKNQLCGCRKAFRECDFWHAVVDEAYGGFDGVDFDRMMKANQRANRLRFIPKSLTSGVKTVTKPQIQEYMESLGDLYESIQTVSDARVIVDSSKFPSRAYLLTKMSSIDVYIVHLVRDSRGVAYSWSKKRRRPGIIDEVVYMSQHTSFESALGWVLVNSSAEFLRIFNRKYLRVHYEDFVRNPICVISDIQALIGERKTSLPFVDKHTVSLDDQHNIAGNPIRFTRGHVKIRLDDAWRREMNDLDWRVVNLVSWPLLIKYGYSLSR